MKMVVQIFPHNFTSSGCTVRHSGWPVILLTTAVTMVTGNYLSIVYGCTVAVIIGQYSIQNVYRFVVLLSCSQCAGQRWWQDMIKSKTETTNSASKPSAPATSPSVSVKPAATSAARGTGRSTAGTTTTTTGGGKTAVRATAVSGHVALVLLWLK